MQNLSDLIFERSLSNLSYYDFSDHRLQRVRKFTTRCGHSSLWPEATTFLSHIESLFTAGDVTVACGRSPQGPMTHKSRQMVTLIMI